MTDTAGLGDDALELVDLLLGTAESTELEREVSISYVEHGNQMISKRKGGVRTLFLASLRARLSLELRSNSITRFS